MSKKPKKTPTVVIPLRVPPDMQSQIRQLASKSRLAEADIMRLAIERGIAAVEEMFEMSSKQAA